MAASPAPMREVDTPSGLAWATACTLALVAASVTVRVAAQPREGVHEVRPPAGSIARGVLQAPRWVGVAGGVAVAAAAGVLLARRSARRSG